MTKSQAAGHRFIQLKKRAGLSFAEIAKRAGYAHASGVSRHAYDQSDYLGVDASVRLADALQGLGHPPLTHEEIVRTLSGRDVTLTSKLRPRSATTIQVVGTVQAGYWHAANELADEPRSVPYVAPAAYRQYACVAFDVVGHSMDRVYPHGSTVVAVPYVDLGRDPRPGERVIVQRYRHDEVEATCKELRVSAKGELELWPLSSRPEHQEPLPVRPVAGERVLITHRVVAAIVHEPL